MLISLKLHQLLNLTMALTGTPPIHHTVKDGQEAPLGALERRWANADALHSPSFLKSYRCAPWVVPDLNARQEACRDRDDQHRYPLHKRACTRLFHDQESSHLCLCTSRGDRTRRERCALVLRLPTMAQPYRNTDGY